MKNYSLYLLIALILCFSLHSTAFSNDSFEMIKGINYFWASNPEFIIKIDSSNYLINTRASFQKFCCYNFLVYNFDSKYYITLDSNIYNQLFSDLNFKFHSGINIDGKLIMVGTYNYNNNSKLIIYENNNGIWGNWTEKILEDTNSLTKIKEATIKKAGKTNLFIHSKAYYSSKLFYSTDTGKNWNLFPNIFSISYNSSTSIFPVSDSLVYLYSHNSFYKVNLEKMNVDSTEIISKDSIADYIITNMEFIDDLNGFVQIRKKGDSAENDTLWSKFYFLKTTDGGNYWSRTGNIRLGSTFYIHYYYKDDFIIKGISSTYDLLETTDLGENWKIKRRNLKDSTLPMFFESIYPIIYGSKYLLRSSNGLQIFNTTPNLVEFQVEGVELAVFPNPVTSSFSLTQIPEGTYSYEIYDIFGIKHKEGKIENEINVEFLPSGIYFLKLNNQAKPIKFVKI